MRALRRVACRLAYASLVVAALATGSEGQAVAANITVAEPPNPNVLLLLDSSGSMENWSDGTPDGKPATSCVADVGEASVPNNVCQTQSWVNAAGHPVSAQNKWAGVIQALSGSAIQQPGSEANGYYTWYEMARTPSSAFANEYSLGGQQIYDINYALNYHRMASWDATTAGGVWCVQSPLTLPNGGGGIGVGSPPAYVNAAPDSWSTAYLHGMIPSLIVSGHGQNLSGALCNFTLNGDGNIDAARDLVRFGLMTFDNSPDPGTNVAVSGTGLQPSFPPPGVTWGLWSYFPGWNLGASVPAWPSAGMPPPAGPDQSLTPYNTGTSCYSTGSASPACAIGAYEMGARNPAAPPWEGRMVQFPSGLAPLTEQEAVNDEVKAVIAATRPYGATPVAGMLTDARNYFRYDPNGPEMTDPYVNTNFSGGHGCRPQYIVLLSDGGFNLDERPTCDPGGIPSPTETCPYQLPQNIAGDLCIGGGSGAYTGGCRSAAFDAVETFVIGYSIQPFQAPPPAASGVMTTCSALVGALGNGICATAANPCTTGTFGADPTGQPDAAACCNLINIACNGSGGTQAPYFADSAADLNGAFAAILSQVSRKASSHVVPVFASASPTGSGNFQSEFFSAGFQTSPVEPLGTAPVPWSGSITRTENTCPSGTVTTQAIPAGAATRNYFALLNTLGAPADDTGTFRPFLSSIPDGFGTQTSNTTESFAVQASGLSALATSDGGNTAQGPFKITDFSCPADPTTGSRLGAVDCEKYVLGFWAGLAPATGTTTAVSAPPTDYPGPLSASYTYANRTAAWLGPVVNSAPAYVTAPSLALSDNTYRAFAQTYSTRPNVLYVETTDGALHALNPDYGITGSPFPTFQEFWSFLPPAVSPNLYANLPGASRTLLDGSPVVADTVFHRSASTGTTTSQYDWHTTLVSSFGAGGPGYFALDVTHPQLGNDAKTSPSAPTYPTTAPLNGPHFLWQLTNNGTASAPQVFGTHGATPAITTLYVQALKQAAQETGVAILPGGSDGQAPTGACTVSSAETGSGVNGAVSDSANPRTMLRSWSTPPATADILGGTTQCDLFPTPNGRAVTIVRLSDGAVIATFANSHDYAALGLSTTGNSAVLSAPFTAPITGTPAVYPNGGGRLATQAYVSDAEGQIWKLNFSGPDPSTWTATKFFDSFNTLATKNAPPGASALAANVLAANLGQQLTAAPILSIGPDSSLVLNFATGDQTLFTTTTFQAGSTLTTATIPIENFVYSVSDISSGTTPATTSARLNWFVPFDQTNKYTTSSPAAVPSGGSQGNFGERVTGPMAVYAGVLYFATLWPDNGLQVCSAGEARIYGLDYFNAQACSGSTSTSTKACGGPVLLAPTGNQYDIPAVDGVFTNPSGGTVSSSTTAGAVIPGVAITQVQPCTTTSTLASNNYFAGGSTQYSAAATQQPQLTFMTTSSTSSTSLNNTTVANGKLALTVPRQPTRIDSWAHVIN
jgi:type IV pilus assembly protein PilY1